MYIYSRKGLFSMAKRAKLSGDRYRDDSTRSSRPSHVRCLNFGRSILELDVATERSRRPDAMSGCVLATDLDAARIPCTAKVDYVRKWIETHENGECTLSSSDPSQLSPVLGASATEAREKSPILGNSGRRSKERVRINRHAVAKSTDGVDCVGLSAGRLDYGGENESENEWQKRTQYTPPGKEMVAADGSPIFGARPHKRRRRRLRYGSEGCLSPKRLRLQNDGIMGEHVDLVTEPDSNHDGTPKKIHVSDDESEEDTRNKVEGKLFRIEMEESPEALHRGTMLSWKRVKVSLDDSSSNVGDKDNPKIETDASNSNSDEERGKLSSTSGSNNDNPSNIIEEVDTQDMLLAARNTQPSVKSLSASSKLTQLILDLDETYCSEAEMMQDQSMHLSTKISLVPSLSKEATGSRLTQIDAVISTITTPSKASLDKTVYARLLDSGKKRHKPKKGSMVAKLQSLVNTQISGIRIWRHRLSKERDASSSRFISVFVRDHAKRFGNQFLSGVLIEDRFNLLRSDVVIEEAESCDVQIPPRAVAYRDVTIMLVCDIVGTLKTMSDVVINVYPPWNVLDWVNLTLEAMYININHSRDIPDIAKIKESLTRKRVVKRVAQEFNCPCIEEERELPFCARRPNAEKPNVMQEIFNF